MKETTSLNIIESNENLLQKEQSCVHKKKLYLAGKLKRIASNPGQMLHHQEVRHLLKTILIGKIKGKRETRSQTTFMTPQNQDATFQTLMLCSKCCRKKHDSHRAINTCTPTRFS